MSKTRVVIRNMDDVINFQVLRWKKLYPEAAEPEEWSDNEIAPDEEYDPTQEISAEDESVILEDDKRWIGSVAGGGMKRRGTYERGYGKSHDAAFVANAEREHKEHYEEQLRVALEELQNQFGDEYDIVYEGEYAKKLMDAGTHPDYAKEKKKQRDSRAD